MERLLPWIQQQCWKSDKPPVVQAVWRLASKTRRSALEDRGDAVPREMRVQAQNPAYYPGQLVSDNQRDIASQKESPCVKKIHQKTWRELQDTWSAIRIAEREKKTAKLKTLHSLAVLIR